MTTTAKEAHQVIGEYRRVVASIKQGQDSLNRLKVEYNELEHLARQIDQALATIPLHRPTGSKEANRRILRTVDSKRPPPAKVTAFFFCTTQWSYYSIARQPTGLVRLI
ncbi:hypothetical protein [Limosilactobacillus fermentum]|uniref:hypothetical protein n=1 Tax=Limosilactobacillus fermentum TaxID=1613 RepID=UPI00352B2AAE